MDHIFEYYLCFPLAGLTADKPKDSLSVHDQTMVNLLQVTVAIF